MLIGQLASESASASILVQSGVGVSGDEEQHGAAAGGDGQRDDAHDGVGAGVSQPHLGSALGRVLALGSSAGESLTELGESEESTREERERKRMIRDQLLISR